MILTGAPGAGKTTALEKLGALLEVAGIPYGALESEQLAWGDPWLEGEPWLAQLRAVFALQRQAGRRLFLVAATTESDRELAALAEAIGAEETLAVLISASAELAATRVGAREPDDWPGKAELVAHSRYLAASMERLGGIDVRVSSESADPTEVAGAILEAMRDRGLIEHGRA